MTEKSYSEFDKKREIERLTQAKKLLFEANSLVSSLDLDKVDQLQNDRIKLRETIIEAVKQIGVCIYHINNDGEEEDI